MKISLATLLLTSSLLLTAALTPQRVEAQHRYDDRDSERYDDDRSRRYEDDRRYEDERYRDDDRYGDSCRFCGTVRGIVRINSNNRRNNNTGAMVIGALIGGALGNQVGSGSGRTAATVVGAVAGGAVGRNSGRDDDRGRRQVYYRVSVRMDNGRFHDFDQYDVRGLRAGSRVQIVDGSVQRIR